MHACMHIYIHTRIHVCIDMQYSIQASIYTYIYTHMYMHICIFYFEPCALDGRGLQRWRLGPCPGRGRGARAADARLRISERFDQGPEGPYKHKDPNMVYSIWYIGAKV